MYFKLTFLNLSFIVNFPKYFQMFQKAEKKFQKKIDKITEITNTNT